MYFFEISSEVIVNELYDGSSKSYPYNIVRLSRILAPGPIVSFGNACRLRRNRSETCQKDSNVVTVFPVLLNEGVIGFLETKGRTLNFIFKPGYNVSCNNCYVTGLRYFLNVFIISRQGCPISILSKTEYRILQRIVRLRSTVTIVCMRRRRLQNYGVF